MIKLNAILVMGLFFLGSCVSPGGGSNPVDSNPLVFTTQSQLVPTPVPPVVVVPGGTLQSTLEGSLGIDENNPAVLTHADNVVMGGQSIPLAAESFSSPEGFSTFLANPMVINLIGVTGELFGLGGTVNPWLGFGAALLSLLSSRARTNYKSAGKSLVKLDLAGTLNGVAKAVGLKHTNS